MYAINIRQFQLAASDLQQFNVTVFSRVIPDSHGISWEQIQPTESGVFLIAHIFPCVSGITSLFLLYF